MKPETRSFPRKVLRCPAVVIAQGAPAPLRARTVDISLGGVCLMIPQQLPIGHVCTVAFEAPLNGAMRQVTAVAKVAYSVLAGTDGFRIGFQFTQIDAANNKTLAELML